jgi:hypothetical protein
MRCLPGAGCGRGFFHDEHGSERGRLHDGEERATRILSRFRRKLRARLAGYGPAPRGDIASALTLRLQTRPVMRLLAVDAAADARPEPGDDAIATA